MTLSRFMTTTAIAAALAMPVSAGFAQPATTPNPAAATSAPHAAPSTAVAPAPNAAASATTQAPRHMATNEMRASKLIGSAVYDSSDQRIGSLADLIVDRDGKITDVVIGVGDKHVAVKMADLKRGKDDRLVFGTTKDALKQMPSYDLNHASAERSGSSTQK
jgi:sporulation protein YlmC with PRC-barrel domain